MELTAKQYQALCRAEEKDGTVSTDDIAGAVGAALVKKGLMIRGQEISERGGINFWTMIYTMTKYGQQVLDITRAEYRAEDGDGEYPYGAHSHYGR